MGALEKGLYADGPEFLVISGGIGIQEIGLSCLHTFEDRAGHFRKIRELIMESVILALLHREIDISKRMGHLMQTDILPIGIIGELPDKVSPGKVDAVFADMTFKRHIIQPKAIILPQYINGLKVVQ